TRCHGRRNIAVPYRRACAYLSRPPPPPRTVATPTPLPPASQPACRYALVWHPQQYHAKRPSSGGLVTLHDHAESGRLEIVPPRFGHNKYPRSAYGCRNRHITNGVDKCITSPIGAMPWSERPTFRGAEL